ncbi:MAG: type II toxin-antitoxin system RelE/ParE family toxin [Gemmataceae bacterium]
MSLPVVLRPEASRDAEEARDYLETRRAGLGQAFLDRLNEELARIGAMPEMYGVVWRNVRAVRLRQFTYVVYYRVQDDRVEVLAVMQGNRSDSAWQARA